MNAQLRESPEELWRPFISGKYHKLLLMPKTCTMDLKKCGDSEAAQTCNKSPFSAVCVHVLLLPFEGHTAPGLPAQPGQPHPSPVPWACHRQTHSCWKTSHRPRLPPGTSSGVSWQRRTFCFSKLIAHLCSPKTASGDSPTLPNTSFFPPFSLQIHNLLCFREPTEWVFVIISWEQLGWYRLSAKAAPAPSAWLWLCWWHPPVPPPPPCTAWTFCAAAARDVTMNKSNCQIKSLPGWDLLSLRHTFRAPQSCQGMCPRKRSSWSCCTWQISSTGWNMLCPVSRGLQGVEGRHAEEAHRLLLLWMRLQNNCVEVPGGSEQEMKCWLLLTKQNFCVLGAQLSLWALSRGGQRDGKGLLLPPDIQKGPGFI